MGHSSSNSSESEMIEELERNAKNQRIYEEIIAYYQILNECDYPQILQFRTETINSMEGDVDKDLIFGELRKHFMAMNAIQGEPFTYEQNNRIGHLRSHIEKDHVRFFAKCVFCGEEFDAEFSHIAVLSHAQEHHMDDLENFQGSTLIVVGQNNQENQEMEL